MPAFPLRSLPGIAHYRRQSCCFADIDYIRNVRDPRQIVIREDCAMHAHVLTTTRF